MTRFVAFLAMGFIVTFAHSAAALPIFTVHGFDSRWAPEQQGAITYCIESGFSEAELSILLDALALAEANWESVINVNFVHVTREDGSRCTPSNNAVLFQIQPVCCDGQAMPPHFARAERIFRMGTVRLIRNGAGDPEAPLVSLVTHELGHVLGFAHEHASGCSPEDFSAYPGLSQRALTTYDINSIMHYTGVCGSERGGIALTSLDAQGAALIYGRRLGTSGGSGAHDGLDSGDGSASGACGVRSAAPNAHMVKVIVLVALLLGLRRARALAFGRDPVARRA